ncbi:hypothetical protein JJB09_25370 [Rhizobium sp. KVB221]|uniref:SH3 domain-containing protein n=1 Tax=Rhizobium setariae TaxID=2801340 RepID=A0A937CNC9_9HYPH|nr:hypothetical protein [Rhizobium setariae]MBL0375350.1 hypothetical protein [Rhizobium setariae]
MTNFITKAVLATLVGLGAMGATSQANAGSVDVDVRIRAPHVHVRPPVVVVRPAYVRPPVVVVRPGYGRCQQGLALQKAANRGMNRVAISNVGPNRVVVSGKIRGTWAKMYFANVRGCPRL